MSHGWAFPEYPSGTASRGSSKVIRHASSSCRSAWVRPAEDGLTGTVLSKMKNTARADGYALHLEGGRLQVNLVKRWLDDSIRVETRRAIRGGAWTHVTVTYDGSRVDSGTAVTSPPLEETRRS